MAPPFKKSSDYTPRKGSGYGRPTGSGGSPQQGTGYGSKKGKGYGTGYDSKKGKDYGTNKDTKYRSKTEWPEIYKPMDVPPLDSTITKFEDENVGSNASITKKFAALSMYGRLPSRPAYGTLGKPVTLRTNYFKTKLNVDVVFYAYDISFKLREGQAAPGRTKKRRYIELLLRQPPFSSIDHYCDLERRLYTSKPLDLHSQAEWNITIHHRLEATPTPLTEDAPLKHKESRERKTITLTASAAEIQSYRLADLYRYVQGNAAAGAGHILLQMMNVVLNHFASTQERVSAMAGNVFYPTNDHSDFESYDLGDGLVAVRGYYSSIRLAAQRVLLNVNVTSAAFYEPVPLDELIIKFLNIKDYDSNTTDSSGWAYHKCSLFLKGQKVFTKYHREVGPNGKQREVVKVWTILGFGSDPKDCVRTRYDHTDINGKTFKTSVVEHYRRDHRLTLRRPRLPPINVGSQEHPKWIPLELCTVVPGQPFRRMLSTDQLTHMLKFAARPPNANAASIEKSGLRVLGLADQSRTIQSAGLGVDKEMLTVPGRVLPPPRLRFGNQQEVTPEAGSWNLANQTFFKRSTLKGKFSWLQVLLKTPPDSGQPPSVNMESVARSLARKMGDYGVNIPKSNVHKPQQGCWITIESMNADRQVYEELRKLCSHKFQLAVEAGVKFILIGIPRKNKTLYAAIKYAGDVGHGIHTVVVTNEKLAKLNPTLIANLALKFSIKSSGLPWALHQEDMPLVHNLTMVMGLDVTHPSPGNSEKAKSIAACVASWDGTLSGHVGEGIVQDRGKEMVTDLKNLVMNRLRYFRKENANRLPSRLLLFRDGVSESQFDQVLDVEWKSIQEAFASLYGSPKNYPQVAIIICGKRHHTRFYPTDNASSDCVEGSSRNAYNPPPGLVVDRHITGYGEGRWDLYLQAHKGLQGTAKPCHYIVIKDQIGMKPDELEQTIHTMSYGFYRATKAVSLCPPAYCADKLAERCRLFMYCELGMNDDDSGPVDGERPWVTRAHRNINDTMYFL